MRQDLKQLDDEFNDFDKEEEKTLKDVEKLVKLWKENKKINGVSDS